MKNSKLLLITAITIALSFNTAVFSKELTKGKVAVIDVQRILNESSEIKTLKTSRTTKVNDLVSFVEKAKVEISKESDSKKKKMLEEKYTKEINLKKEDLDKEYIQNLSNINTQISNIIKTKSSGYDFVFTKNSLLQGGVDITNDVIKELK